MQNKERKSNSRAITKELNKAIDSFMKGQAENAFASMNGLEIANIPAKEQAKVQKVLLLLLSSTLFDITTLKELLTLYGIKSNNYSKIWQKLTHQQVYDLFVMGSRAAFKEEFVKLLGQSQSSQSRAEITIVGDDSTFQQWLTNAENDPYYGVFFSGQYKKMVHGFCVSLVGVVLKGTFYPLSFRLIPKTGKKNKTKTEQESEITENAEQESETGTKSEQNSETEQKKEKAEQKIIAEKKRKKSLIQLEKGIKDVHRFILDITESAKAPSPQLYCSVDGGFSNKELMEFCCSLDIITISVAKHTEVLFYKGQRMNFKALIDTFFLPKEAAYYDENPSKKGTFLLRLKVFYQKLDEDVTVLIFRLNGSNKVTVIFCHDNIIHAKTMRRHFFQRTQIEQFFRMVKHTLDIDQSTTQDSSSFIKKVAVFFLKAIFAFTFRNYCRKHFRRFKNYSFYKLRKNIVHHNADKSILSNLLKTPFAKKRQHKQLIIK